MLPREIQMRLKLLVLPWLINILRSIFSSNTQVRDCGIYTSSPYKDFEDRFMDIWLILLLAPSEILDARELR